MISWRGVSIVMIDSTKHPDAGQPRRAGLDPGSGFQLDARAANDRPRLLLRRGADDQPLPRPLLDDRADHDLVLGECDAAKLDREPLEMLGTSERLGLGARQQGHRVEAVKDPPGKPNRLGELIVEMDRIEVAGGAGVARSAGSSAPGSSSLTCAASRSASRYRC